MKFSPIFLPMLGLLDSSVKEKTSKISNSTYLFSDIIKVHFDQETGISKKNIESNDLIDNNFLSPDFNLNFKLTNDKTTSSQKNNSTDKNNPQSSQPDASLSSIINLINQLSYSFPKESENAASTKCPAKYLVGFELKEIIKKIAYLSGSIDYNQYLSDDKNSESGKIITPEQLLDYLTENNKAVINVAAGNQELKIEVTGKKIGDPADLHGFVIFDQNLNHTAGTGESSEQLNPLQVNDLKLESPAISGDDKIVPDSDLSNLFTDIQNLSKHVNDTLVQNNSEKMEELSVQPQQNTGKNNESNKSGINEKIKFVSQANGYPLNETLNLNKETFLPEESNNTIVKQDSNNKMFEVKVWLNENSIPTGSKIISTEELSPISSGNVEIILDVRNNSGSKTVISGDNKELILNENPKENSLSNIKEDGISGVKNNYKPGIPGAFKPLFTGLKDDESKSDETNIRDYSVKNLLKYSAGKSIIDVDFRDEKADEILPSKNLIDDVKSQGIFGKIISPNSTEIKSANSIDQSDITEELSDKNIKINIQGFTENNDQIINPNNNSTYQTKVNKELYSKENSAPVKEQTIAGSKVQTMDDSYLTPELDADKNNKSDFISVDKTSSLRFNNTGKNNFTIKDSEKEDLTNPENRNIAAKNQIFSDETRESSKLLNNPDIKIVKSSVPKILGENSTESISNFMGFDESQLVSSAGDENSIPSDLKIISKNNSEIDNHNSKDISGNNTDANIKSEIDTDSKSDAQQKNSINNINESRNQNLNQSKSQYDASFKTETLTAADLKILFNGSSPVKQGNLKNLEQPDIKIDDKSFESQKPGDTEVQPDENKNANNIKAQINPSGKTNVTSFSSKQAPTDNNNYNSTDDLQNFRISKSNPFVSPLNIDTMKDDSNENRNNISSDKENADQEIGDISGINDKRVVSKNDKADQDNDKQKNQTDLSTSKDDDSPKQFSTNSTIDRTVQKISSDYKILDNKNLQDLKEDLRIVSASKIIKEISNLAESRISRNVVLKLTPEDLGKVKISMDVSNNRVHLNVEVENDTVKNLIHTNSAELKQSLAQNGLQLNSLNISLSQSEQKSGKNISSKKKMNFNTDIKELEIKNKINVPRKMGYNTYEYLA